MNEIPAFIVRAYPAFRMARLHRVYVDREALYLIRMAGVLGLSDAGGGLEFDPGRVLVGAALRWWAGRAQDARARELDARGPREMLDAHRQNARIEPGEVVSSTLGPPRMLGHGAHLACWKLEVRGSRARTFQIEDAASLKTALVHLPRLLGQALSVSVAWDKAGDRPVPRI